jgi:hypothetical protein
MFTILPVAQADVSGNLLFDVAIHEVHQDDTVDRLYVIRPLFTFAALLGNSFRSVIDHSPNEVWVTTLLHLNNNLLATVSVAKDVVDAVLAIVVRGYLFLVKIAYIGDVALSDEQTVQEVNQYQFILFLSEEPFESGIGERTHVFCVVHDIYTFKFNWLYIVFFSKVYSFFLIRKCFGEKIFRGWQKHHQYDSSSMAVDSFIIELGLKLIVFLQLLGKVDWSFGVFH